MGFEWGFSGIDRPVLAPDLHKGSKTFVQRSSVLDQDRPLTDMIKVGARLPQAGLQVTERLPRLAGKVAWDHAARTVDTVLTTDHDQIVSGRDAHGLRKGQVL